MTDYKHSKTVVTKDGTKRKYKIDKDWKVQNVGRPPIEMTPEIIRKLEEIFHIDGTVEEACLSAGIWSTTYYKRIDQDPEFARKMAIAQQFPKLLARKTLIKSMRSPNEKVAQKGAIQFLSRRDKRYSTKVEADSNINLGLLSDEDLKILEDLYDQD